MSKHKLAVLFADDSNSGLTHNYFSSILDSFKRTVENEGCTLSFLNCAKGAKERSTLAEQVVERNFDGILVACINYRDPEVIELLSGATPFVTIDEAVEGAICVSSDNVLGIREMVKYIGEMGHRKIAYIHGDPNTVTGIRLEGFMESCWEMGVKVPEEYIRPSKYRDMRMASFQTEELMRLPDPPTCILYSDDFAAIGGMNVLRARGLAIPEHISVAGYDGISILDQYAPRLSTVRQDTVSIGRIAAEKLLYQMDHPTEEIAGIYTVPTMLEKGKTIRKVYSY